MAATAPTEPTASTTTTPLTIDEWRAAQTAGDGLTRLLSLVAAEAQRASPAWIALASPDLIEQQWHALPPPPVSDHLPLYGIPFAVKDNIDALGFVTTAGCPQFSSAVCTADAPVVARLKAAGAVLVGKTNLDQFATGLNGTRSPHYGIVPNAWDPAYVSGGSSSGSAVVVSRGTVPFALGTDTAGSGRVPAGLNNIVGLKPTRGALSTRGVLPACRTLDCVSILALTAHDAAVVLAVAEGYDRLDAYSRSRPSPLSESLSSPVPDIQRPPRIAICSDPPWFGQTQHKLAYDACLDSLRHHHPDWSLHPIDFAPLFDLARLLYSGPWVAERYQALRPFIEQRGAPGMDPVVRGIIMDAAKYSAADAFAAEYDRQRLTRRIHDALAAYDVLLVPTTPTFPSIDNVRAAPVDENARLGTYTNFVNFLDWTALSLPAGFRPGDGLPFGITLIARTWQEPLLLALAGQWLGGQTRLLGATGRTHQEALPRTPPPLTPQPAAETTDLVVVGAHLTGLPLNNDLVQLGATFKTTTTTAPAYKLYALAVHHGAVLERVTTPGGSGRAIAVEVWSMPTHSLGRFLATIPHPLGLGRIELADASWSLGVICESAGLADATDITEHGGWKAYLAAKDGPERPLPPPPPPLSTVLIANRGEIAIRIIRTLHAMRIRAVAVYAAADAASPHVRLADHALPLGPGSVADTYLNGPRIIDLARSVAADAVIPGYGFLAENADFADAVEAAGMAWVGPTAAHMRQLGLKHAARRLAEHAGLPVVPGTALLTSVDSARAAAHRIGYPVLLKSTAGGGGSGLQRCDTEADLVAAFATLSHTSPAVFLEKWIPRARHIEVQVLGDGTGRVLVVGDRDGSVQRRHQKLVEEAPAPFVPDAVRHRMHKAAADLVARVRYRSVGTVEFLYDATTTTSHNFFFLEVNTRLQVEHPTTEAVTGLDLVQCMLHIAAGRADAVFTTTMSPDRPAIATTGVAIEARLYAESPLQQFRPSSGRLLDVALPFGLDGIRVDTWIERGLDVSSAYDPLLAKIVATGPTRADAIQRLAAALAPAHTRVVGIETNAAYLRHIVRADWFAAGDVSTHTLDALAYTEPAVQVLEPGPATTVQDWPGRTGLWHIGVPPSGPMDPYSFRLANQAVGNAPHAPALECTHQGPTLLFHAAATVAVTGATAAVCVDGTPVDSSRLVSVAAGQTLSVGVAQDGYRICVAVRGGFAVPSVLGSRATFELGRFGGHNGRPLQRGDILRIGDFVEHATTALRVPRVPLTSSWRVGVIPGPHGAPDFFTADGLALLFASPWTVHYNSNRMGVRLSGCKPQWARATGGEAGLHPSNVHDSPYSVGSVSFTGDEAVVVTCDGPSLGGFVVFCVVADAEMWKLGQARPGDEIRFVPITAADAIAADQHVRRSVQALVAWTPAWAMTDAEHSYVPAPAMTPIVGHISPSPGSSPDSSTNPKITVRQAGDQAVLLEFGDDDVFDLARSFQIFAIIEAHRAAPLVAHVLQLTPGVRTLHVHYALGTLPATILATLTHTVQSLHVPQRVVSRRLRLPIVFGDEACRQAVHRYASTIRKDAPWLMDNVEFLRQLNGLDAGGVEAIVAGGGAGGGAEFLVVGLGDVFLGSPCAVPLDPRHRLFGIKYNPSRSFTPAGAVGIGGQYMCIYAGDSPGGYQLVGRTVGIWDPAKLVYGPCSGRAVDAAVAALAPEERPWKFRMFDRISFYPVRQSELAGLDADQSGLVVQDDTDPAAVLDLAAYTAWLAGIQDEVAAIQASRRRALASAPLASAILQPAPPMDAGGGLNGLGGLDLRLDACGQVIRASVPGRCFRVSVQRGDAVQRGDELLWLESNKMEMHIASPLAGRVASVRVEPGQAVMAEDVLMSIVPVGREP